jgi:alkylresorcinol/alkylpyrone synthase
MPGFECPPHPKAIPMTAPRLASIATAVPPHVIRQEDVVDMAAHIFDRKRTEIERLMPVYANAGIDTRYSCVPLDWYAGEHSWAERNAIYVENAVKLLADAAMRCLDQAGRDFADIDALVTVSTTGISTPSLDALLLERLPFRRDVMRLPVFGLGCAGGVLGLARAASLARAQPGARVLFLVVELCALTFRKRDQSKSNIIATALFGDGAAAALLESDAAGPTISTWGEYTWPDSLDVMGWNITNDGLGVLFSRDIPTLVRTQFREATDRFLEGRGLGIKDIDAFVCHPGGAKVISALEESFGVPEGTLDEARAVLRQYGNMSAATVLFVLERMLAQRRRRYLMTALGPGFTAGFLTLEGWA